MHFASGRHDYSHLTSILSSLVIYWVSSMFWINCHAMSHIHVIIWRTLLLYIPQFLQNRSWQRISLNLTFGKYIVLKVVQVFLPLNTMGFAVNYHQGLEESKVYSGSGACFDNIIHHSDHWLTRRSILFLIFRWLLPHTRLTMPSSVRHSKSSTSFLSAILLLLLQKLSHRESHERRASCVLTNLKGWEAFQNIFLMLYFEAITISVQCIEMNYSWHEELFHARRKHSIQWTIICQTTTVHT